MSELEKDMVYRVRSDEDDTVLLGRWAGVRDGYVYWDDTVRERMFPLESLTADGETVVAQTAHATYRFEPLTLTTYNKEIKQRVELSPDFESTEALQTFYRDNPLE